ncbi:MAG: pyridoxal phosphate-dependent aminotransferase [Spirochaetaceae bacterium]|nr:pyridoxal phosphate-dependent aminotransferase [Spirochaetaceae bacterium]
MIDFDELHDRKESYSVKWNNQFLEKMFGKGELLPFWVADMDFRAPQVLIENLKKRSEQGFYGYEFRPDSIKEKIAEWCYRRHEWEIDVKNISFAPNVLNAISVLIELNTNHGEGVIIQPPVYYPFEETIISSGRKVVYNRLIEDNGLYRIDFKNLKEAASDRNTRAMILCSPHNPVGRVWTEVELTRIAQICFDENVLLISDEIHMEFVFNNQYFLTTALLEEKFRANTVQLFSTGKTFNLSGNTIGIVHFNNRKFQNDFNRFIHRYHLNGVNVFTTTALETVFTEGEPWLNELLTYLEENLEYVLKRIKEELPEVIRFKPEGTYLLWLSFAEYGFKGKELEKLLVDKADIALDPGRWFGEEYSAYARLNIGCCRELLTEAIDRITALFKTLAV